MNAADVTHGLKLIGGNTRMWVGIVVIVTVAVLLGYWLDRGGRGPRLHPQFHSL